MGEFAAVATTLVTCLVIAGCAGAGVEDGDGQPAGTVVVRSDQVAYEQYTGIEDRRREVIRSRAEWEAFWDELTEGRRPQPRVPSIDFDREIAIVAAMGQQPTGGHSIRIDEVRRTPAGLSAVVVETTPGPGCVVTQAVTAPVHVTRVAVTDRPVRFVEQERVQDCS